jgi:hypothetical protein
MIAPLLESLSAQPFAFSSQRRWSFLSSKVPDSLPNGPTLDGKGRSQDFPVVMDDGAWRNVSAGVSA